MDIYKNFLQNGAVSHSWDNVTTHNLSTHELLSIAKQVLFDS